MYPDFKEKLADGVRHFWFIRESQSESQGNITGKKDTGNRTEVTGGKHSDGFIDFVASIVRDAGLKDFQVKKVSKVLPGYFRPTKGWDLVVIQGQNLVAAVEVKSHVGSFGNNFNNRVEEALGTATDFWKAYEKGRFAPSPTPWIGYFLLVEETDISTRPTQVRTLHPFPVDDDFQRVSYLERYEQFCVRLVRERCYNSVCLVSSEREKGKSGVFREPCLELNVQQFSRSLYERVRAFVSMP